MRRLELQEIHDHPAFPGFLRDLVTDAMQSVWEFANSYKAVLGRLLEAMEDAGAAEVLDLCSGGGGPWLRLAHEPELRRIPGVSVRLTDKYPNRLASERAEATSSLLRFEPSAVDATRIPGHLSGFRTFFSSFHHFGPETAHKVLRDAMEHRQGVGIFEMPQRSAKTIFMICCIPAFSWFLAPTIRPFKWSRLFWIYVVPVVPFVLFYDGIVSCLRAYSHEELEGLVAPLATPGYEWRIGEERSEFLPVTYLLGYPIRRSVERTDYSIRNAVMGSRRDARHAGTAQATAATASSMMLTTANTNGSSAVVP
jgi:hypothetical protein